MTPSLFSTPAETLQAAPKAKPRGRPFQKGSDPRRMQEQLQPGEAPRNSDPQMGLLDSIVAEIARRAAGDAVDETRVREIVADEIKTAVAGLQLPVSHHTFKVGERPAVKVEGLVHPATDEVLFTIAAGIDNVLLVGPAGCGKTVIAETVARALGRPFAALTFSGGTPEWHLTGRALPNTTTGESRYEPSASVIGYESGHVLLWDELDAADPNMLIAANTAMSNGHWPLPHRVDAPLAKRHADTVIIGAANTYGTGANRVYAGRNQLDGASLDRFACTIIEVDYDRDLERQLVNDDAVCARFWEIRDKVQSLGLRRIVSMRATINAAKLHRAGMKLDKILRRFTTGWTDDERHKVGVL